MFRLICQLLLIDIDILLGSGLTKKKVLVLEKKNSPNEVSHQIVELDKERFVLFNPHAI